MNVLEKLTNAVDYIENNLTSEISLSKAAQLACCSSFDFQRMFAFIADISVVEYIRRRRLTLAAFEMQQKNTKVIDVALKYGYDSPVSFSRAFRALHGITPTQARNPNILLKAFSRISFQICVKGVSEMDYRIVKTTPFKVFGNEGIVSTAGDKRYFNFEGEIWQDQFKNGKYDKLFADAGDKHIAQYDSMFVNDMCKIHGLANYKIIDDTTYGFMLCSFVAEDSKTDGYLVYEIPETTWVVFPCDMPDWDVGSALKKSYKYFYGEWLPTSDYEKVDAPQFEMYGGTKEHGYIELWFPIRKGNSSRSSDTFGREARIMSW